MSTLSLLREEFPSVRDEGLFIVGAVGHSGLTDLLSSLEKNTNNLFNLRANVTFLELDLQKVNEACSLSSPCPKNALRFSEKPLHTKAEPLIIRPTMLWSVSAQRLAQGQSQLVW